MCGGTEKGLPGECAEGRGFCVTQGGHSAWEAGGCHCAAPPAPCWLSLPQPLTHTYFSLADVAEELMGSAGGAGVILGPACPGTCARSLRGTTVRSPGEKEALHALQQPLPQACEWKPRGSAPGQSCDTGGPPARALHNLGPGPNRCPLTRDAIPDSTAS